MEKLTSLLEKLKEQARLSRKTEAYARELGLDDVNEKLADEIALLSSLSPKDVKDVRKEFDEAKREFRKTLSSEQAEMYDRYEALGAILTMLSNGQQK